MGQRKWLSSGGDLPYHIVMGMPALSPTMEAGTVSKWNVAEGDSFAAGDSLAVIETDKATIDFEAQDEGVVAKLLVPEGGEEINVGVPILVTVDEEADVAAFANFIPDAAPAEGGSAETAAPAPAEIPAASPSTSVEDLPYHIVVGMPALSPTMEAGTVSKWNVAEGEAFAAGDSIAVIETDKASIDFEAQDDGVLARRLVEEGSGEVLVGVPIMVTVEEEADVAAFKDFVAGGVLEIPTAEAPAPTVPAAVEKVKAEPALAAAPTPVTASPAPTPAAPAQATAPLDAISLGGSAWGRLASEKSPLARLLASKQNEYTGKYGSTGHAPIV